MNIPITTSLGFMIRLIMKRIVVFGPNANSSLNSPVVAPLSPGFRSPGGGGLSESADTSGSVREVLVPGRESNCATLGTSLKLPQT